MLVLLDLLLRRLLSEYLALDEAKVSFVAPDASWRNATPAGARLSLYLVDVRENVKLRSNERLERQVGTTSVSQRSPYRLDCHYLISAFAPPTPQNLPEQHRLLFAATSALVQCQPLVAAKVYPPGSSELSAWNEYADIELPMLVNPHEGFPRIAEFWGTLEAAHPWQPVVYVVVTLPVEREEGRAVELVRMRTTRYLPGVSGETSVEIGGLVRTAALEPVARAWVMAGNVTATGRVELARTNSEDDGTFRLRLPVGATHIWAAAFGRGTTALVQVPPPGTNADFTLTFS